MTASLREGVVKAYWDCFGHFFATFAHGCKGLVGWFGQFPYVTNTYQRGASLTSVAKDPLFRDFTSKCNRIAPPEKVWDPRLSLKVGHFCKFMTHKDKLKPLECGE